MDNICDKSAHNSSIIDEKHIKYHTLYKGGDIYWGLGIENEVYLEFISKKKYVAKSNISTRRERYSVDYTKNYRDNSAFEYYVKNIPHNIIGFPLLLNAHSFTKTDIFNNPKNLYTKACEPNPVFTGTTLLEFLKLHNDYFTESLDKTWLFDGDTIEFNTLNFYNTTLSNVIDELVNNQKEFVQYLNSLYIFNMYSKIDIMTANHPFAIYMTNDKYVNMFNNGTLHYNITLPTALDNDKKIIDMPRFIKDHCRAIRIIQWMEPFIIAVYGSPDPFSNMQDYPEAHLYSKSSQRCAISRYIGVGTYDSDTMIRGKILQVPVDTHICNDIEYWWYHEYYKKNGYTKLDKIGMDINFNKHYNHGIECKFFDHLDKKKIHESFEFIIYLMDYILDHKTPDIKNPITNKIWNALVCNCMIYGKEYTLNKEELELYSSIFNIKLYRLKNKTIKDVYYYIYYKLICRYSQITNIDSIIPCGNYSKLTLTKYDKEQHNSILHTMLDKKIKALKFPLNIVKKICSILFGGHPGGHPVPLNPLRLSIIGASLRSIFYSLSSFCSLFAMWFI